MSDQNETPSIPNCNDGANRGHSVKDNPEEFMKWLSSFADAAADFDPDEDEKKGKLD